MFGARYVVDVLRGAKSDKIENNRHDKLALFGIGRERSDDFWRGVLRQLVARGALRVKSGEYASLELVDTEARPILRGETQVMLHEEPTPTEKPRARKSAAPAAGFAESTAGGETLFDALRAWRMQVAKAQAVPPYVIFHDVVLRDIAAVRPADLTSLGEIKGVGASKLERYGASVLDIIQRSP